MILLKQLTVVTELKKAITDPDHIAHCKHNPHYIHYQCLYCGKINHITIRNLNNRIYLNRNDPEHTIGLFCNRDHFAKFTKKYPQIIHAIPMDKMIESGKRLAEFDRIRREKLKALEEKLKPKKQRRRKRKRKSRRKKKPTTPNTPSSNTKQQKSNTPTDQGN